MPEQTQTQPQTKDREMAKQITKLLIKLLTVAFGYCFEASGEKMTLLNSGESLTIKIEVGD